MKKFCLTIGMIMLGVSGSVLAGPESYHNWYFGGSRGSEQGTHGIGMGNCPFGQLVVGIQYFEGGWKDWVDGIGVHCATPDGSQHHYSNWYSGGSRKSEQGTHGVGMGDCPWGQFVAGVQYFEGGWKDWVDGIGVHCETIYGNPYRFHNWYFGGSRGSEQGTHGEGMGDCPAGQFVVGIQYFEGGWADWVDGIGVHCAGP